MAKLGTPGPVWQRANGSGPFMRSITSLYAGKSGLTIDAGAGRGFDGAATLTLKDDDSGLVFADMELVQRRLA